MPNPEKTTPPKSKRVLPAADEQRLMAGDDSFGANGSFCGPGADGYFLRSTSQVEELLRWFSEMHAAGVTVRGGRLRPQKQKPSSAGSGSYTNLGKGTSRRA